MITLHWWPTHSNRRREDRRGWDHNSWYNPSCYNPGIDELAWRYRGFWNRALWFDADYVQTHYLPDFPGNRGEVG